MTSNSDILCQLRGQGIFAEERNGYIVRTLSANDTECGRDDVEALIDGKWQLVVASSLDWERELPAALEAVKRGEHPFPLSAGLSPKLPDEAPPSFADTMVALARQVGPPRVSEMVIAEHPEL